MDIFLYGDIGGHFEPFMESLQRDAGVDLHDMEIPEGTVIVQVGDLVHRGPDSDALVDRVDHFLKTQPKQWVQLFGNHEGNHIGGPMFSEDGNEYVLLDKTEKTLRRWWKSKQAHMAAAIKRDDGREVLVTHAGLCLQTWATLGEPLTASDAARALNRQDILHAFAPGWLLGGYVAGPDNTLMPPGVAWASAAKEVYPSWENRDSYFDQIHGHSGIYNWSRAGYYVDYSIQARTVLRKDERFSRWKNFDDHTFVCIDQALGADTPYFDIKPLHITGEVLIP